MVEENYYICKKKEKKQQKNSELLLSTFRYEDVAPHVSWQFLYFIYVHMYVYVGQCAK